MTTSGDEIGRPSLEGLPPRLLPILYFALAHASLLLALLAVAIDPRSIGGFFYHARMVAIVHLVTLGWISSTILGSIYIVGPMALRMPMPPRPRDYWAFGLAAVGIAGMASHFWIAEFSGMAWSAGMVTLTFVHVALRVFGGLASAPIPRAIKLHVALAFINVLGAAAMGVVLGLDKLYHFLPGFVLSNVYAHAHLAAIGWASMMVVGVGYRLLPMVLPAAMPQRWTVYLSAILLEIGAAGLFVTLLRRSAWTVAFALLVCAGFAAFFVHVGWMMRNLRRPPTAMPRPDYGVRHAVASLCYLAVSAVVGLALASVPMSEWTLRAALAYGAFGLIGFLAQMVVGMETRILPMFAWYWAFANTDFRGPAPRPHEMPVRWFDQATFYLWLIGVPSLAGGLFFGAVPFLAFGAWTLLAGLALRTANTAIVLRHAYKRGDQD
ncbi:MAG: hypothetical protein HYX76_15385 [Acidobacteria bacterium]|nr:hypothetical protein [Acidobacteriota bacterium]